MKLGKDLREELRRIEAIGNDDFQLILLGGPEAYATHELRYLLRRLRIDGMRQRKYRKQLFRLAGSIPLFLGLATFAVALNKLPVVYFLLACIGLVILVLAWGYHNLQPYYERRYSAEELRAIIQQELARRRSDAEIQ